MQWWHTNDIADPPTWQRMQVYPNPMLGSEKSARMVNSAGEEFFNQQQDDPLAYGPYTVQLKALARQVHAGKARYDGGYYAGFDHCDPQRGGSLYDLWQRPFASSGCAFPSNWSRPRSPRITGRAASTSTRRRCARRCPVSMSPGGLGGHSNGLIGLATYDGKVVADGVSATCRDSLRGVLPKPRRRTKRAAARQAAGGRAGDGVPPSQVKADDPRK